MQISRLNFCHGDNRAVIHQSRTQLGLQLCQASLFGLDVIFVNQACVSSTDQACDPAGVAFFAPDPPPDIGMNVFRINPIAFRPAKLKAEPDCRFHPPAWLRRMFANAILLSDSFQTNKLVVIRSEAKDLCICF
jgi:hypothetical protein